jgi:3-oxoacyl-[acyl-carrier protein] reductase
VEDDQPSHRFVAVSKEVKSYTALQRYAQPDQIADFVGYLASPGAAYLTGAGLRIDGGYAA